jgi:acyl phosphate:glycerol-3-phosphate acyltransferase
VQYVVAALMGYWCGAVPVSALVARRHGVDLRRTGDGNPGAWNALEQLGARRAWPAFAGDAAKAFLAALAGYALGGWWTGWAGVAAAMVGHAFPVFARFRGGKSVMAFVGGSFALAPAAAFLALGVCLGVTAASSFKWGARAAVFGFPLIQLAVDPIERVAATGILMGIIGALFGLDRLRGRSAPATSAPGAGPTG